MRWVVLTVILGTIGCGGGGSPALQPSTSPETSVGTRLAYTDPASRGWRLVRNSTSLPTRLILTLVGPDGAMARGVGLTLHTDTSLVNVGTFGWQNEVVVMHPVFQLDAWDAPIAFFRDQPILFQFKKAGNDLSGGVFQKDPRYAPAHVDRPIVSFALEFRPEAQLHAGASIPLSVAKAAILPADLSTGTGLQPVEIAVGTLSVE